MNKLLLTLLGLSLVCHDLAAAVISFSNPTPTHRGINRDIYIAKRTDGRRGTGTADDPFDGSTTAKFDAAFVSAVTASSRIHLGPGVFTTAGNANGTLRFGLTGGSFIVRGAGIGVTTIKLADGTVTGNAVGHSVLGQHADDVPSGQTPEYVEICELTVDANRQNQPSVTNGLDVALSGLGIGAKRVNIHDVRLRNAYGKNLEAVGIHVGAPAVTNTFAVISRCEAIDLSGWMTAINLGGTKHTNRVSGIVRDCIVIGDGTSGTGTSQNAFGGWYLDSVQWSGNRAQGIYGGFIVDSWTNRNLSILGNTVLGSYAYGVIMNGPAANYDGIKIVDNFFGSSPPSSRAFLFDTVEPSNLFIFGNRIESDVVGTTNVISEAVAGYLKGLTNGVQSQINALLGGTSFDGNVTNGNFYGSHDFFGSDQTWTVTAVDTPNAFQFSYNGVGRFILGADGIRPFDTGFTWEIGDVAAPVSKVTTTNLTFADGTSMTTAPAGGGGAILQATNRTWTNTFSTVSTTYTNTGFTVTLGNNLQDTSARVLVRFTFSVGASTTSIGDYTIASWDGVTETLLTPSNTVGLGACYSSGTSQISQVTVSIVDTPASVTPREYRLMLKSDLGTRTQYIGNRGLLDKQIATIAEAFELE